MGGFGDGGGGGDRISRGGEGDGGGGMVEGGDGDGGGGMVRGGEGDGGGGTATAHSSQVGPCALPVARSKHTKVRWQHHSPDVGICGLGPVSCTMGAAL